MEAAAVRLYFLSYNVMHIIWVNSCTRNKINFSKDNIARGLCTLVPFITIALAVHVVCIISAKHFIFSVVCAPNSDIPLLLSNGALWITSSLSIERD